MSNAFLLGVLAGAAWNAASVWVMGRMLQAWLAADTHRGQAIGWLLVKLGVVYPMAWLILRHPAVSLPGFSVGFTLILFAALAWFAARTQPVSVPRPHGR